MTLSGRCRRGPVRWLGAFIASCATGVGAQVAAPPTGTLSDPPEAAAGVDLKALPDAPPWRANVVYKLDLLRLDRPRYTTGVGDLEAVLDLDAEQLFGWSATTLRLHALSNQGGQPGARLATLGGLSNLEVVKRSARLYAAWLSKDVAPGWNGLVGLYDLNSEFYVTDASSLLVHPAFGVGTEFGLSGRNGPSIFPNLSFGIRVRLQGDSGSYAQTALLDGVPGDPNHPGRTVVRLRRGDGVLAVGEAGWRDADAGSHWAVGAWGYSRTAPRIDGPGDRRSAGAYVLAQQLVAAGPAARTTAFVRAGVAEAAVNAVAFAAEAGVLFDKPFGAAGPAALSAGLATARPSGAQRRLASRAGEDLAGSETVLEVGVRWTIGRHWVVQPLWQHVWRPGARRGERAAVVGARLEWALFSSPG